MANNKATQKRFIVGKAEAVAGTAETLADADFDVRARGPEFTPDLTVDDEASKFANAAYTEDTSIAGMEGAGVTFMTKVAEGASLTTKPKAWKMLNGCGLVDKTYTLTGVALQDSVEGDLQTMTIGSYDVNSGSSPDAVGDLIAGAMGNAQISVDGVGGSIQVQYDFGGKYQSSLDVANANLLALTSPDTTVAEAFKGITVTFGGTALCVQNFNLDLGNTVEYVKCPDESTGIKYKKIVSRAPRLTATVLKEDIATYDPLTKWKNMTSDNIVFTFGNFVLDIPRAQLLTWSNADESGTVAQQLNIKLLQNLGQDSDIDDTATFELLQGTRV